MCSCGICVAVAGPRLEDLLLLCHPAGGLVLDPPVGTGQGLGKMVDFATVEAHFPFGWGPVVVTFGLILGLEETLELVF